jgi:hypothetical protein
MQHVFYAIYKPFFEASRDGLTRKVSLCRSMEGEL